VDEQDRGKGEKKDLGLPILDEGEVKNPGRFNTFQFFSQ
jgi:hypothetical protein